MAEFNIHLSPPPDTTAIHQAPLPSPAASKCNGRNCPWWPYTNSTDFKANTALILVILFCALICAMALNAAVRYIIRIHCIRRRNEEESKAELDGGAVQEVDIAAVIYSEGVKLKGADAECIICLSEFAIGDKIRVLENCNHGFHVRCIQKWLISHSSCPTCRTNCTLDPKASPP
ncbi:hypothetical protein ACJIZ3_005706 [Penstemon smallii]|uniref:RING-type E3 ubiquitin transferase n=1 Tax=Penstemon smallii TaxID=265156 RepID=A0ABD3S5M4_9LAMI